MKTTVCILTTVLLVAGAASVFAEEETTNWRTAKASAKRQKIDAVAGETLETLFAEYPKAKALYDKAHGYAVFDNLKISLVVTGGGGVGVAVNKGSGTRTYMRMGTGGLNVGLGGQKYQVVFLFEDAQTFTRFVEKGWQADASANAVAGPKGANAATSFTNGMAVYQLTEGGLMLQADISGTKYWNAKRLNATGPNAKGPKAK